MFCILNLYYPLLHFSKEEVVFLEKLFLLKLNKNVKKLPEALLKSGVLLPHKGHCQSIHKQ